MKLRKISLVICAAAALMLAGCGGSESETQTEAASEGAETETIDPAYEELKAEIEAVVPQKPEDLGEVELGEYMGIAVNAEAPAEISADDALLFIEENVLPNYLEETNEPAQEGYTVNIDFEGKI
uniref:hypothetical protein n=1 Tax=Barnesiella viscericola TaxID=397865 RepID=UPI00255C02C0